MGWKEEDNGLDLGWFIAGVAVGVAVGMVMAPKSGKETREYLAQKAGQGKDRVASGGQDFVERGRDMYQKGREIADEAADLFERGRRLVRGEAPPPGEAAS